MCDRALLASGTFKYRWILELDAASLRHMAAHSSDEYLAEIAEILAAGLTRLWARKSSGLLPREPDFSLGTLAQQSGAVAGKEGDTP